MTSITELQVHELFENAPDRDAAVRENPVTGGRFVGGVDPIGPQKQIARRALEARDWFGAQKPYDAPELPLTDAARERLKGVALTYVVSVFARSLAYRDYRTEGHPDFDTYASGVMASSLAPDWIRNDVDMVRRFPPKVMTGLGSGLIWRGL